MTQLYYYSQKKILLLNHNEKKDFIFLKIYFLKRKTLKGLKDFNIKNSEINLSQRVEELSLESLIFLFRDINCEIS